MTNNCFCAGWGFALVRTWLEVDEECASLGFPVRDMTECFDLRVRSAKLAVPPLTKDFAILPDNYSPDSWVGRDFPRAPKRKLDGTMQMPGLDLSRQIKTPIVTSGRETRRPRAAGPEVRLLSSGL